MNRTMICLAAAALVLGLSACSSKDPNKTDTTTTTAAPMTMKALQAATTGQFQPVPLPDPKITGYKFPEQEDVIVGWTKSDNRKAIELHGWGLWTSLMADSGESFEGQKLRVFETWYDPADLSSTGTATPLATDQGRVRNPRRLQIPRQFEHGGRKLLAAKVPSNGESTVLAFVKYDPSASDHILKNNLFSAAQLSSLLQSGKAAVPDFPDTSISLKPVFRPLTASQLVAGRYFQLKSWPGSPNLTLDPADQMWHSKPFPSSAWGQCIWIDVQDVARKPGTGVDHTCSADGKSRTDANTYGVDEFVNFRLSQAEAAAVNSQFKANDPASTSVAAAGNYAVLIAMHVTSREITRWTWQTYWWTYQPDRPSAPSSPATAGERPVQLTGAARHYAQCTAYQEVKPVQPNTGGSNTGESVYCFNPYLEAPFDPSVLPDSQPGMTTVNAKLVKTPNDVGAQTNCMSCHEQATFNPNNIATAPNYTGDRYVDLNSPAFKGVLKVDFLWSIPGNVH